MKLLLPIIKKEPIDNPNVKTLSKAPARKSAKSNVE
jgi:hypothetical protein